MDVSSIAGWINDGWIDDSFFLHYHPSEDSRHYTEGFGDSVHHTGFYVTGLILLDALDDETHDFFLHGIEIRDYPQGLIRHPRTILEDGSFELCNRDQFTPFLFAANHVDPDFAKEIYSKMKDDLKLLSHHKVFFERSLGLPVSYLRRLMADSLELVDTVVDKLGEWAIPLNLKFLSGRNGIDSSIVKNGCRGAISLANQPTFMAKVNWWFLNKCFDLIATFTRYFTFRHNKTNDNPPPVHLIWLRVLQLWK